MLTESQRYRYIKEILRDYYYDILELAKDSPNIFINDDISFITEEPVAFAKKRTKALQESLNAKDMATIKYLFNECKKDSENRNCLKLAGF